MAGYDGSLKFDTEIDEKGFNQGITKLGSLAKGGIAVLATAVTGVAAAFGAVTKASLDSVASLEQNIGGVETLFKNSAQTVIDNANNAYKTAGVSANKYMETVTSFSASLLQGLGGDTAEAARIADMAMVDMSDNANKFGTNMQDIQNAYQGFAKQNYTMLDNLKLGYGGTQEEMIRLINDSGILNEKIDDLDNVSFDQIIQAIHKIQENMGIAGTTSKEALTTIEGSVNAAKAAFDNFLNGSGSPEELADSIITAGKNIASNLSQIIPRLAKELPEVGRLLMNGLSESLSSENLGQMIAVGGQIVTNIVTGISSAIPVLVQRGYELLSSLVNGFVNGIPEMLPQILDFIQQVGERLAEAAPILVQKGFELLSKLAEGIVTAFPILIEKVPAIISTFANIINDNFPTILAKGAELLGQLALGLIQAIPTLVSHIPQIIQAIIDALMAFQWVNLGRNIIKGLGDGIGAMKDFVKQKGKDILNAIKGAIQNLPSTLLNIGKSAVSDLGGAIRSGVGTIKSAASGLVSGIVNTISSIPGKMLSIGKNIVRGLWNGISDMTGWVLDKIKGFGDSVLGGIKSFFGIKSPSRLMRDEVGKYLAQGVGVGFAENVPTDDMTNEMKRSVQTLKTASVKITAAPVTGTFALAGGGTYRYDDEINGLREAILKVAKASNRPVVATFNIDGKRIAKVMAKPMTEEQERLERLNSRKRGIKK